MSAIPASGARLRLSSISLAHLLNDSYMNLPQTLLPFLVAAGLPLGKGSFLVSAFAISSSLVQPFFGYLVDRRNQRWMIYAGTLWMAMLLGLLGVLKSYPALLFVCALSGLGTAAFHPQASAMVSSLGSRGKGLRQSAFIAAGNVGWALTPLLAAPFIQRFGLSSLPLLSLPAFLAVWLVWRSERMALADALPEASRPQAAPPEALSSLLRGKGWELLKLVSLVALRSLSYFGFVAFLPLYLMQSSSLPLASGGRFLFAMLFAGALGGMLGGFLSDSFGRKPVISASLALATPFFLLFLLHGPQGIAAWILLALAGASLLASFSVAVVLAQELLGRNSAMASGLMLGFGIGIGGLGVGVIGLCAERWGLSCAVQILAWLPLLAAIVSLFLKGGAKESGLPARASISAS